MVDLSYLNFEQKDALLQSLAPDAKTCVLAGAGSGKTRVITARITYMIEDQKIPANKMLVMTFTNKAANEMKERVEKTGVHTSGIWMGTFHSTCVRLLKAYGAPMDANKFTILDEDDKLSLVRRIIKESGLNIDTSDAKKIASRISSCKNELKNPNYMRSTISNSFDSAFTVIYEEYQRRTWAAKLFDYDDLIIYAYLLLKNYPDVRDRFRARFPFITVDEFQDTNDVQFKLLAEMVGPNNLYVVGDDWQSIYGFRAAKPGYIINFNKYFPTAQIKKFQLNYRSTKTIVDAGNFVIKANKNRTDKHMVAATGTIGELIHVHHAKDSEAEADYIATYIQYLKAFNVDYKDIAILYRSNYQSRIIEQKLNTRSIPYRIIGSISFFDRKEVKDMLAFLKLYVNHADEISYRRILSLLPRVGSATIDDIIADAKAKKMDFLDHLGVYSSMMKNKAIKGYGPVISNLFIDFRDTMASPSEAIQMALDATNYIAMATASNAYSDTFLENINELINSAIEFGKTNPSISAQDTIADFIDQLMLTTTMENQDGEVDAVNLMTLHSSKGLEFKAVICCGWAEGVLPHANSLASEEGIEEERRLAYVGVSRAKERLLITHASQMMDASRKNNRVSQSRFLGNIPKHLVKDI